jgi:hypothetical protein
VGLEAEMFDQLDLQRPLQQPLRQLGKQATRAGDLILRAGAGQQLVDQSIRKKRLDLVGELGAGIQRTARSPSASLRSTPEFAQAAVWAVAPTETHLRTARGGSVDPRHRLKRLGISGIHDGDGDPQW